MKPLRVTFLGTGTSTGVPVPTCACPVCTSKDPHDARLRPSVRLQWFKDSARKSKNVIRVKNQEALAATVTDDKGWTLFHGRFTAPRNAKSVRFVIYPGADAAWLDDLYLRKVR